MGLFAMDVDDETNAASVMLKGRVVKSLFRRRAAQAGRFVFHAFNSTFAGSF
jgi:hypothetical protein